MNSGKAHVYLAQFRTSTPAQASPNGQFANTPNTEWILPNWPDNVVKPSPDLFPKPRASCDPRSLFIPSRFPHSGCGR